MPKVKVYAIARGLQVGIYHSWAEAEPLVKGFVGAKFKSFSTMGEASSYLSQHSTPTVSSAAPMVPRAPQSAGNKVYAVARGLQVGIYHSWAETEPLVKGFDGAKFKSFSSTVEAKAYIDEINASLPTPETQPVASGVSTTSMPATVTPVYTPLVSAPPPPVQLKGALLPQVVYTDGACPSNGQRGARGGYGVFFEPNPHQELPDGSIVSSVHGILGADPRNISQPLHAGDNVTNNVAELRGIIGALTWAIGGSRGISYEDEKKGHGRLKVGQPLHIYTDSTYCIKGITLFMKNWLSNGFKKSDKSPVLNKELWISIHGLMVDLQRQFESASFAGVGQKRERDSEWYESPAVKFIHVKGHSGVLGNEAADGLAVKGAMMH